MLFKQKSKLMVALCLASVVSIPVAYAQKTKPGAGGRGGPPPEAIEACAELTEEASCSFIGKGDEELSGICMKAPRGEILVCGPADGNMQGQAH